MDLAAKKDKLLHYCGKFKRKEASLNNLKQVTTVIRYTLKYLNKYPVEFKDVFQEWLKFAKDFILRSDANVQVHCMAQVSIVLLNVLRIKFRPIYLIEDFLTEWIEVLAAAPNAVIAAIVKEHHLKIRSLIRTMKSIGHYKLQSLLLEILNRYLITIDKRLRYSIISEIFDEFVGYKEDAVAADLKDELIQLLRTFDMNNLEMSNRLFLNKFNWGLRFATVETHEVLSITVNGQRVDSPANQIHWIDLNRRTHSLSFYGKSNAALWNYFEVMQHSVAQISRGLNLTVSLELNSKLTMSFCEEDSLHVLFDNAYDVVLEFDCADSLEDFLAHAIPVFRRIDNDEDHDLSIDNAGQSAAGDLTNNTLNLSVLSRSFHNGDLNGRFSFRGDSDDDDLQESQIPPQGIESNGCQMIQQREMEVHRPIPKRKLYSHELEELIPPSTMNSMNSSQESLIIVVDEEDLPGRNMSPPNRDLAANVDQRPSSISGRIFKTNPAARVPIYQTILDDWKSDAHESSFTFINNDPPGQSITARGKKRGRPPGSTTTKKAKPTAAKRAKKGVEKLTKELIRKIVKRPSKAAAEEAKRVFALQNTPPFEGEVARNDATVEDGNVENILKDVDDGNGQLKEGSLVRPENGRVNPFGRRDFENFQKEVDNWGKSMGRGKTEIRKLKTRVMKSARCSDADKTILLHRICDILLKN